ncbi:MAG: DNA-binding protein [Prevotella sp.]|nr:DNA-binding protein [Prevotella sp.]
MSVKYRLIQNKIKSSKNYGKYYAHTVKSGDVTLEEIERMIEQSCSAKASDVRMVVKELFDSVRHYLQAGYVVKLGDLGRFSISVKSVCVDDPRQFRADRHLNGFKCNYTPAGRRYKPGSGDLSHHIHRDLLDGCKAEEVSHG